MDAPKEKRAFQSFRLFRDAFPAVDLYEPLNRFIFCFCHTHGVVYNFYTNSVHSFNLSSIKVFFILDLHCTTIDLNLYRL